MLGMNPRDEVEADRLLVQANNVAPLADLPGNQPVTTQ